MGKAVKKSVAKVVGKVEDIVMAEMVKPLKKAKRESEELIEKNKVPAKKRKVEEKKTQKKIVKKVVESSSDDDTSSESEDLKVKKTTVVAVKKVSGVAPAKVNEDSSDESGEETSSDDDNAKTKTGPLVAVKQVGVVAPVNGNEESSDDSDSEDVSDDNDVQNTAPISFQKKEESDEDSDSDKDSSSDEDNGKVTPAVPTKKEPSSVEHKKESSFDVSDGKTSSDEDASVARKTVPEAAKNGPAVTAKYSSEDEDSSEDDSVPDQNKIPAIKKDESAKVVKRSSSDDNDDESKDEEPQSKKTPSKNGRSEESSEDDEDSDDSSEDEKATNATKIKNTDVTMIDAVATKANVAKGSSEKQPKTPSTPKIEGPDTIFIGNLSFSVEQADVENLFKDVGKIVDIRFSIGPDGVFKGYAHIQFDSSESAAKAVQQLNQKDLLGRPVNIDFARERGSYTPQSGGRNTPSSFQKGGRSSGQTAFVRGLNRNEGEDEIRGSLKEFFGSCGDISRISIPKEQDGGLKGIAYIDFKEADAFNQALELNGSEFGNGTLTIEEARPRVDSYDGAGGGGRGFGRVGDRDSGGRFGGRRGGRDSGGRFGGRFASGGRGRGSFNRPTTFSTGKKTTFND